jgi:gas vesicle protein
MQTAMSVSDQGDEKMGDNIEKRVSDISYARNIVIGVLIGGLAGAAAMLLLAPQSGKQTRAKIQREGILLLDRTTEFGKNTLAQVRSDTREIATGVREKAVQLKQQGQNNIVKQLDRVSAAVEAA